MQQEQRLLEAMREEILRLRYRVEQLEKEIDFLKDEIEKLSVERDTLPYLRAKYYTQMMLRIASRMVNRE